MAYEQESKDLEKMLSRVETIARNSCESISAELLGELFQQAEMLESSWQAKRINFSLKKIAAQKQEKAKSQMLESLSEYTRLLGEHSKKQNQLSYCTGVGKYFVSRGLKKNLEQLNAVIENFYTVILPEAQALLKKEFPDNNALSYVINTSIENILYVQNPVGSSKQNAKSKTINSFKAYKKRKRFANRVKTAVLTAGIALAAYCSDDLKQIYSAATDENAEISQQSILGSSWKKTIAGFINKVDDYFFSEKFDETDHLKELIDNLYSLDPQTKHFVYIRKDLNTMRLYTVAGSKILFGYAAKTTDGLNSGPREKQGDKKTPEGVYRISWSEISSPEKSLDQMFGSAKLILNYPSAADRKKGRTGEGIVVCGTDIDSRKKAISNGYDCTNGSIATSNNAIEDLMHRISGNYGKTLVIIEDAARPLKKKDYEGNF